MNVVWGAVERKGEKQQLTEPSAESQTLLARFKMEWLFYFYDLIEY